MVQYVNTCDHIDSVDDPPPHNRKEKLAFVTGAGGRTGHQLKWDRRSGFNESKEEKNTESRQEERKLQWKKRVSRSTQ